MSNSDADRAAAQPGTLPVAKFDPAAITAFCQSSVARLMRSGEVFRRGMAGFKPLALGGEPEERVRAQFDHAAHQFPLAAPKIAEPVIKPRPNAARAAE